jgi:hypothetical protein
MPGVGRDRVTVGGSRLLELRVPIRDRQPVGRYPSSRTIIPSINCHLNEDVVNAV